MKLKKKKLRRFIEIGSYEASWWGWTSPPMNGCLKMYMLWQMVGLWKPNDLNTPLAFSVNVFSLKTGLIACKAWPILLKIFFDVFSLANTSLALFSKNGRILSVLVKKYKSDCYLYKNKKRVINLIANLNNKFISDSETVYPNISFIVLVGVKHWNLVHFLDKIIRVNYFLALVSQRLTSLKA